MRRWFVAVTTAVVLTLTACSASGDDPGPTPEPTTEATVETPSPDPSPTEPAAEGPVDRSDPELGITFEDLPEVSGRESAAVDAYTQFEVLFWQSLTEGEVAAELDPLAADPVRSIVQAQVDGNASGGWSVGGRTEIRFLDSELVGEMALIDTCQSADGVVFTSAEEELTGREAGFEDTVIRVELDDVAGPWRVVSYTDREEPC